MVEQKVDLMVGLMGLTLVDVKVDLLVGVMVAMTADQRAAK